MFWSRKKLRLIGKNRREREREGRKWIPFCIFGAFYGHSIPNYIGDNRTERARMKASNLCQKLGPIFDRALLRVIWVICERVNGWKRATFAFVNCTIVSLLIWFKRHAYIRRGSVRARVRVHIRTAWTQNVDKKRHGMQPKAFLLPTNTESSQESPSFHFVLSLFFEKLVFRVSRLRTTYRRYFDGYRYETKDFYLLP